MGAADSTRARAGNRRRARRRGSYSTPKLKIKIIYLKPPHRPVATGSALSRARVRGGSSRLHGLSHGSTRPPAPAAASAERLVGRQHTRPIPIIMCASLAMACGRHATRPCGPLRRNRRLGRRTLMGVVLGRTSYHGSRSERGPAVDAPLLQPHRARARGRRTRRPSPWLARQTILTGSDTSTRYPLTGPLTPPCHVKGKDKWLRFHLPRSTPS